MPLSLIVSFPGAVGCLPESLDRPTEDCMAGRAGEEAGVRLPVLGLPDSPGLQRDSSGIAAKDGSTGPRNFLLDSVGTVLRTGPCEAVKEAN